MGSGVPGRQGRAPSGLRERHQERADLLKRRLREARLPVMPSPSHVVPVLVGDARLCKELSDDLLEHHRICPLTLPRRARRGEGN
jgi:5-aminolevulinate synthase